MLNIQTATREDLEVALLENDELMAHVGGLSAVGALDLEMLRAKITEWIEAGDETHESSK